ncbi:MAG: hypothetical protein JKX76_15025 [Colwellia sp.]|nr:hypothetical protein [Colwellia sp.]
MNVLENRSIVLKAFSLNVKGSDAERGKLLTTKAIESGYVSARDPVSGAMLQKWLKAKEAPAWAYNTSLVILLDKGWSPQSEDEWNGLIVTLEKMNDRGTIINLMRNSVLEDYRYRVQSFE